eukprot:1661361-Amphidinium_carterae.1
MVRMHSHMRCKDAKRQCPPGCGRNWQRGQGSLIPGLQCRGSIAESCSLAFSSGVSELQAVPLAFPCRACHVSRHSARMNGQLPQLGDSGSDEDHIAGELISLRIWMLLGMSVSRVPSTQALPVRL